MDELSTKQLMENFINMENAKNMNMLEIKLIDMGVFGDELEQMMTSRASKSCWQMKKREN